MAEPGTTVVGDARNRLRVGASQVKFAAASAPVYENAASLAACRPNTPTREGPCAPPLSPGSAEWQILHCCANTVFPAVASAPRTRALAARRPKPPTDHAAPNVPPTPAPSPASTPT